MTAKRSPLAGPLAEGVEEQDQGQEEVRLAASGATRDAAALDRPPDLDSDSGESDSGRAVERARQQRQQTLRKGGGGVSFGHALVYKLPAEQHDGDNKAAAAAAVGITHAAALRQVQQWVAGLGGMVAQARKCFAQVQAMSVTLEAVYQELARARSGSGGAAARRAPEVRRAAKQALDEAQRVLAALTGTANWPAGMLGEVLEERVGGVGALQFTLLDQFGKRLGHDVVQATIDVVEEVPEGQGAHGCAGLMRFT